MAEAAVEDRQNRFYCHICNVQFETASANFTCPHCSGGFIEELDNNTPSLDADGSEEEYDNFCNMMEVEVPNFFLTPGPPEERSGRTRHDSRRRRAVPRPPNLNAYSFDDLIQQVVFNMGVGVNWGGGGNMQLFLGNPGDYAWGREGLDAIVTQLLNQLDGTGPPPLSKEVIDALPLVEVNGAQVEAKAQCSVCWEDFVLKECVRQLPCQHIYHEPCIRPWLELHGTCPICRQNLGSNENADSNAQGNASSLGGPFSALQNLLWSAGNRSNSPSSSTATRGSDSPTSSNSSSSNRDSRM